MAEVLGLCPACASSEAGEAQARAVHIRSRRLFDLPEASPQTAEGVLCGLCGRRCLIGEGETGFCGLRSARDGRLRHLGGTAGRGLLHWYRDPLPTNCVAAPFCHGSAERGKHNLAVFYNSCTLDCLFCQNWHFRMADLEKGEGMSAFASWPARVLADCARSNTYCVCYFGGDPASQMPHALATSRILAQKGVVICWETAGTANERLMDRAFTLSLETGGCIKFDLKAWSESLHVALTGWSNRQTLANFSRAASRYSERPDPPLVIASTPLVPGYISVEEVSRIASFIAGHDPRIPYVLLAFGPHYLMPDLPRTSVLHAEEAYHEALDAGLHNVRIGNRHLLGHDY